MAPKPKPTNVRWPVNGTSEPRKDYHQDTKAQRKEKVTSSKTKPPGFVFLPIPGFSWCLCALLVIMQVRLFVLRRPRLHGSNLATRPVGINNRLTVDGLRFDHLQKIRGMGQVANARYVIPSVDFMRGHQLQRARHIPRRTATRA